MPNFTILSNSTIEKLNLKRSLIYNNRLKIFDDALEKQKCNLNLYTILTDNLFYQLNSINPTFAKKNISIMKSLVLSSELENDQIRRQKLNALIRTKSNVYQPPEITIFNTTDIILPEEIQN
jgi:hypothetical protein